MIGEILMELLEAFFEGAIDHHLVMTIQHDGPPARYLMIDLEERVVIGFLCEHGDDFRIYRGHRLLIEPIAQVMLRPLNEVARRWEVQ